MSKVEACHSDATEETTKSTNNDADVAQDAEADQQSGPKDDWHSCGGGSSSADSPAKESDDEPIVKEEGDHSKSPKTELESESKCPTTGSGITITTGRGATSSRARRGGSRAGLRGRGGNNGGAKKRKYGYPQWGEQPGDSDFHRSLFESLEIGSSFEPPPVSTECQNEPFPTEGFLSRDKMIQLTANINNGFNCMNNALELIKQGQLELYNARHTLERLYRGQHGDLELTNNNLTAPFENSAGLAVNGIQDINNEFDVDSISKSYSAHANAIPVMPDAESFQVQLDPYQFMEAQPQINSQILSPVNNNGQRGRVGRPRGSGNSGRGRRGRKLTRENSMYNSEIAQKGLRNLIKHISSTYRDQTYGKKNKFAAVVLCDLLPVLKKTDCITPNRYSSSKIASGYKREFEQVLKAKKGLEANTDSGMDTDIGNMSETRTRQPNSKQVSKISNPHPPALEENKTEPILIENDHSTTDSDPDTATQQTHKNKKIPRWKQLKLDPETKRRIHLAVLEEIASSPEEESKSIARMNNISPEESDKESFGSTAELSSSSSLSESSNGPTFGCSSIKKSKPDTLLLEPSHLTNSTSSDASPFYTPPNEVMLDLKLNDEHCACSEKNVPSSSPNANSPSFHEALTCKSNPAQSVENEDSSSVTNGVVFASHNNEQNCFNGDTEDLLTGSTTYSVGSCDDSGSGQNNQKNGSNNTSSRNESEEDDLFIPVPGKRRKKPKPQ